MEASGRPKNSKRVGTNVRVTWLSTFTCIHVQASLRELTHQARCDAMLLQIFLGVQATWRCNATLLKNAFNTSDVSTPEEFLAHLIGTKYLACILSKFCNA